MERTLGDVSTPHAHDEHELPSGASSNAEANKRSPLGSSNVAVSLAFLNINFVED